MYKNFCLTSIAVASCSSAPACNVLVTKVNVFAVYSMYALPFSMVSQFNSKHQALVCCGVFCAVTCNICHAATSLMDEVFINQEADPYVIEADGTLDVAALQLQPATVVINGSVITPTSSCTQNWPIGTDL